jgi:glutaminyl-peptide cyclotransferase
MKKYNLLRFILLGFTIVSCGDKKNNDVAIFSLDETILKEQYVPQEILELAVKNLKSKTIDSITYYINDNQIKTTTEITPYSFKLKNLKLGFQNLKAEIYFEGEKSETSSRIELVSPTQPSLLKYKIINTYPHDPSSFTEGLEFFRDTLYESTGLNGKSYLRKYDFKTGKIYKQVDLNQQYFGEGITIINDKIYQLTWKEKTGFIYNANTLKLEKTFTYDKDIEGWGMTNDGSNIYQTDGSEKIWKMNPNTQKMIDYVNVYSGSNKIPSINELEWINGKIYCNVWQKDAIAIVNPTTGSVESILDLSNLRNQIQSPNAEVLNGIAYHPKNKTIFVTGKNWDKIFEIIVTP